MFSKSELKTLFLKRHFRPAKRLGQNFLIDGNIRDKIIRALSLEEGDIVIEIGPGLGALTEGLAEKAGAVFAVEKDRLLYSILKEGVPESRANTRLILGDILDYDIPGLLPAKKIKVVGNLPYYATTPIVAYLIDNREHIESALLTVQKEVAGRFLASPGTKDYGAVTCFVQYHTEPRYLYTIKSGCFYPKPEVDSALISLKMRRSPPVKVSDEKFFFTLIRKAFNQRRKAILNSLTSKAMGEVAASREALVMALERSGINPLARPESLSLRSFAALANTLLSASRI